MNRTKLSTTLHALPGTHRRTPVSGARKHSGLGIALAAVSAFAMQACVSAQNPTTPPASSPISTSPMDPWYYSALGFHQGGVAPGGVPVVPTVGNPPGSAGTSDGSSILPLPWAETWGTDTNIYPPFNSTSTTKTPVNSTLIPSYVLGNYRGHNHYDNSNYNGTTETPNLLTDETQSTSDPEVLDFAPDKHGGALYNNFRDTTALSWSAPFVWTYNNSKPLDSETLDDDTALGFPGGPGTPAPNAPAPAGSGTGGLNAYDPTWTGPESLTAATYVTPAFNLNLGITQPLTSSVPWTQVTDSTQTATNNEYYAVGVIPPVVKQTTNGATVVLSNVPTATATWSFTIRNTGVYSLFVNVPLAPNVTPPTQTRIVDAEYSVVDDTNSASPVVLWQGRISQTEDNTPQFVAGPFVFSANQTINLVLDNTTLMQGLPNTTVVVADSAILAVDSGHDVRGGAAVINKDDYPEIANASYYGIEAGTPGANGSTVAMADPVPFGAHTTDTTGIPATATSAATPPRHDIRQLVYFGDSEVETLTTANGTPYQHFYGAVYCVDGTRGNIVWRYRCPDQMGTNGELATNGVFDTPIVTRINVIDPANHANTDSNKLVVIFGDQNGKVYCLDAIGNGIQPANTVSTGSTPNVFSTSGATIPNQVYTAGENETATTNYSMPLDYTGGALNAWTGSGANATLSPCPSGGILDTNNNCHTPLAASTTPLAVQYSPGYISLIAGTTVYWVFRPDPAQPISSSALNYGQDDQGGNAGNLNGSNWFWNGSGTPTNGTDIDGTAGDIPWTGPITTTVQTPPLAANNEYMKAAAVVPAAGSTSPAQLANFAWNLSLTNYTTTPPPTTGTYGVYVTIPPDQETRTTAARYQVFHNGQLLFDSQSANQYIDQDNKTGSLEFDFLCNVTITSLSDTVKVVLYNSDNAKGATETAPGSAQTGSYVVADAAYLSQPITTTHSELMPIPGAFNQASPAIYVMPGSMTVDTAQTANGPTAPGATAPTSPQEPAPPASPHTDGTNKVGPAFLYVVNSNGTLYSIDPTGTPVTSSNLYGSLDIDSPTLGTTPNANWTPTVNVRWWFSVEQPQDNSNGQEVLANTAHIDSAPSILVPYPTTNPEQHRIFFADAGEVSGQTANQNQSYGRVYAVDWSGPVDNTGQQIPQFNTTTFTTGQFYTTGNYLNYNLKARPAWSFPDAYGPAGPNGAGVADYTAHFGNAKATSSAPALGDITGSPVPFYNPDTQETRIYFAANSGNEYSINQGSVAVNRADPYTTGRIWSVADYWDPDQSVSASPIPNASSQRQSYWSFPSTFDPNDTSITTSSVTTATVSGTPVITFPQSPMGAFYHSTPALGLIQFPREVRYGTQDATGVPQTPWYHLDVMHNSDTADVKAPASNTPSSVQPAIPMLYIGCAGDSDTGFYALDLDGGNVQTGVPPPTVGPPAQPFVDDSADVGNIDDTSRFMYRMESPNGFAWTSSPALIVGQQAYPNNYWNGTGYANETNPADPVKGEGEGTDTDVTWGSGGAIYMTAGDSLYQIQATPITNLNPAQTGPFLSLDAVFQGFGPLSQPAVGACNVSGLENSSASTDSHDPVNPDNADGNASYADPNQTTEWIYCADQSHGVFRGITPQNQAFGVGSELSAEMPTDILPPNPVNLRIPLHAYIGAVSPASPPATLATLSDMTPGTAPNGGPGGMLSMGANDSTTFFDWGSSVYVRVTNVVPPNPGDANYLLRMADPTRKLPADEYLTNGSPVSYTITEVPATQVNSGTTFTDYQASGSVQTLSALPGDGFAKRTVSDSSGYTGSDDYNSSDNFDSALASQTLVDNVNQSDPTTGTPIIGDEWLYASTYFIGNGTGHPDTPGAVRRIINATQTCQVYKLANWWNTNTPGTPTSDTVTLTTELTQGAQYQNIDPTTGLATGLSQTIPSPDPTFGIANPLSVIGVGVGIQPSSTALVNLGGVGYSVNSGVYTPTLTPTPSSNDTNGGLDVQANGNFVYASAAALPTAGLFINYDPTQLPTNSSGTNNSFTPNGTTEPVETNLSFIHDGTTGTNGLNDAALGNVGLNMGDRSQVGLRGMSIRVNAKDVPAQWFDSSALHGAGAVINPLPWEDVGQLHSYDFGSNGSLDYPDIPTSLMQMRLNTVSATQGIGPRQGRSGDLLSGSATLDPRDESQAGAINTYSDTVQTSLNVPKYQPANVTSEVIGGYYLPEGYTAVQRVFVDTNNNGQWDEGEAYRDFDVKTGVPINAATHMGENTIDVGTVTGGFGVQMEPYLSMLDPLITTGNAASGTSTQLPLNTPDVFSPYTAYFQKYFQPISVYNDGNINLLNIHMDQRTSTPSNTLPSQSPLQIGASTVDPYAAIQAVDQLGVTLPSGITLPNSMAPAGGSGSGTKEVPFLLRSSLDTDLVQAYGRNPALFVNQDASGSAWSNTYQGATFHKARPGSASPSELTVPDYNPAITDVRDPWYTSPPSNGLPSLSASTLGTYEPTTPTVPYVSVEVPLGTPAGTYSDPFSVYDGSDPQYPFNAFGNFYGSATGTYTASYPEYGGQNIGGEQTQTPTTYGTLDTFAAGNPFTDPTAQIKVTVGESRLTDAGPDYVNTSGQANGTDVGTLPQIPNPVTSGTGSGTPSTPTTLPDFYPAAVRDIYWNSGTAAGSGDLALLWSSARLALTNTTNTFDQNYPPLNLTGAFITADSYGRFQAQTSTSSLAGNYWWNPSDPFGTSSAPFANVPAADPFLENGVNFGSAIAQDQPVYSPASDSFASDGSDYAFWVNTDTEQQSTTNSGTGLSTIWCAKFDPTTSTLGTPDEVTPLPTTPSGGTSANAQPITAALRGITGVRGLKYSGVTLADPNSTNTITNNLWAFWTVGGRGQSTVYYESGVAANPPTFTGTPLALQVPAGLSSISDPSAVIIPAPDTTATTSGSVGANPAATPAPSSLLPPTVPLVPPTVPLIEITYAGTNQDGSSDIYTSRYRPYLPSASGASSSPQDAALWPVPYPVTDEQLRSDPTGVWWSSRDIGWVRNSTLLIVATTNPNLSTAVSTPLVGGASGAKGVYDKASGLMVYTNLPTNTLGAGGQAVTAVYVDLPHGRVRFSPALAGGTTTVNAWVNPMARRITASTQPGQNSEPISFIDEAFGANEAASAGVSAGVAPRVQAARRWFIYRKTSGSASNVVNATLWMNTQRLGIPLYNSSPTTAITGTDLSGKATTFGPGAALTIDPSAVANVSVVDETRGVTLYPSATNATSADIDWVHGYVYFPLLIGSGSNWVSPEGDTVEITFTPHGATQTTTVTDVVRWVDEPQFNDSANGAGNGSTATVQNGTADWSAAASTSSNERAVPMQSAVSESNPFAFLDPIANADVFAGAHDPFNIYQNANSNGANLTVQDQPHRVWLFWSSTRDAGTPAGTNSAGSASSDLFYEALAPAFGAD